MGKKTMGGFIAALRRAGGMTQKELADRLNVSDKAVSRWERDENAPDLSLIPVIAELFGVTCDELLRGERASGEQRAPEDPNALSRRGEAERKRLLASALASFRSRSLIAAGIGGVGLLAALAVNFGLLRGYLGFFLGAVFWLTSGVCEGIFASRALLAGSGELLSREDGDGLKVTVFRLTWRVIGLDLALMALCLPMMCANYDTYRGVTAEIMAWLSPICMGIVLVLYCAAVYFLNAHWLRNGTLVLPEKDAARYWSRHKLKGRCAAGLLAAVALTAGCHVALTAGGAYSRAERTTFTDYDSFKEFMERDEDGYGSFCEGMSAVYLTDQAGNDLVEVIPRNRTVEWVNYGPRRDGCLPIEVVTWDQLTAAGKRIDMVHLCCGAGYVAETAAVLLLYFKKRAK